MAERCRKQGKTASNFSNTSNMFRRGNLQTTGPTAVANSSCSWQNSLTLHRHASTCIDINICACCAHVHEHERNMRRECWHLLSLLMPWDLHQSPMTAKICRVAMQHLVCLKSLKLLWSLCTCGEDSFLTVNGWHHGNIAINVKPWMRIDHWRTKNPLP